jgi:hypothetical protein
MMGHHTRSESLFYYFRLEDQVPESHLLGLVDKHIDFGFVREQLKDSYSETGRDQKNGNDQRHSSLRKEALPSNHPSFSKAFMSSKSQC